jgi:hypothetical protein
MTRTEAPVESALDDPVRSALTGPQVHLAERHGQAGRYRTDVAPFAAVGPDPQAWADLRAPGAVALPTATTVASEWEVVPELPGAQLVDQHVATAVAPGAVRLTVADVPEMLTLVAMAGERLRLPGWTEISAVCTAPSHQGRGRATALVRVPS